MSMTTVKNIKWSTFTYFNNMGANHVKCDKCAEYKRPFFNVKKWNIGKIALECEEWSLKRVENGPIWCLSMKSAS